MKRLSLATLGEAPGIVERPGYDPRAIRTGVVHFGPGAFHRAHQAVYYDSALANDPRWGVAAVSLRTPGVVSAMAAQDGLYTVASIGPETRYRIVAPHRQWLIGSSFPEIERIVTSPDVRVISMTVTEKGYCLDGNGQLDSPHPDIAADMLTPEKPRSIVGWIARASALRRAAGMSPAAILCCDNMTGNGVKLRAAVLKFAGATDPALADWIGEQVAFPDTMVDSITPASDPAFLQQVSGALGMEDQAAVQREPFRQWVIARDDRVDLSALEAAGVMLTGDVAAYERAKLRMLNGAHSILAYLGLARGHETVADAMTDGELAGFVEATVRNEIIPTIGAAGFDLHAYAGSIFERFANPAIRHLLSQIAWDGSQKLPYRLLDTIIERRRAGASVTGLTMGVAAWIAFVRGRAQSGEDIVDPHAKRLLELGQAGDAATLTRAFLNLDAVFPALLAQDDGFRSTLEQALARLLRMHHGSRSPIEECAG